MRRDFRNFTGHFTDEAGSGQKRQRTKKSESEMDTERKDI